MIQGFLPSHPALVDALVLGFRAATALALLGLWTRSSLALAAALGLLLLPLAQVVGPTVHNHHLFWILLLLAATGREAAASWSLDRALGRSSRVAEADARARIALAASRMILGLVYFFPGFWKLRTSGLEWFEAETLTHLFHSKWFQFDFVPRVRIDHYPAILGFGGACVVLLELAFPLLMLTRRGRSTALVGGLTFHVLSAQFLGIRFAPLWLCYGVLVDWRAVDAWLRSERLGPASTPLRVRLTKLARAARRAPLAALIGILAGGGFWVQGMRGQGQAWPWACYPTFEWRVGPEQRDVIAIATSGEERVVYPKPDEARRRTQHEWGQVYRLLGIYGDGPGKLEEARCAYVALLVEQGHLPARTPLIELYEARRPTRPERWGEQPRVGRRLARCTPAGDRASPGKAAAD